MPWMRIFKHQSVAVSGTHNVRGVDHHARAINMYRMPASLDRRI